MRLTQARLIGLFLALTFGGSGLVLVLFGGQLAGGAGKAFSVLYPLPVLLATLIVQGPILKQPVLAPLGLSAKVNRWWAIGWLAPLLVLLVGLLLCAAGGERVLWTSTELVAHKRAVLEGPALEAFEGAIRTSSPSPWKLVLMGLAAGLTLNALLMVTEEVGWRGLLYREMPGGFWARSLSIGAVFGLWLAPMAALYFPGRVLAGAALLAAYGLLVSPVLVYLRARAESVLAPAIFRGTTLALLRVAVDMTPDTSPLVQPFFGAAGLAGVATLLGALYLFERRTRLPKLMIVPRTADTA